MGQLNGKIALVTGGNSGIGLAAAKRFIEEGAFVYVTGRRAAENEKAVKELGKNAAAIQTDVTDLSQLDKMYAKIKAEKGSLDILVVSAGMAEQVMLKDLTPEHFDRIFNLNVRGAAFTVQKSLPLLKDGASIVLVSSGIHLKGIPANTAYAATKAALRSFARTWAAELKERKIRVNSLSPGLIDTPIIDLQTSKDLTREQIVGFFAGITPLGRIGKPEEMAAGIFYLASSESSYTTGFDLVCDGGIAEI